MRKLRIPGCKRQRSVTFMSKPVDGAPTFTKTINLRGYTVWRMDRAELASEEEPVAAPQGIVFPDCVLGTGLARAPRAASTDPCRRHGEAEQAGAPAVSPAATPSATATPLVVHATPAGLHLLSETSCKLEQQQDYTCTRQISLRGSMPAQANQQMLVHAAPVQSGRHLAAALPTHGARVAPYNSISLQQLIGFGADHASELYPLFDRLFTPKHPSVLPRSQWLSYTRLFSIVQPYSPGRVWKRGRGNLMQLVIEWCQHQPIYAGLAQNQWCTRMKEDDRPNLPAYGIRNSVVYRFCLVYTP